MRTLPLLLVFLAVLAAPVFAGDPFEDLLRSASPPPKSTSVILGPGMKGRECAASIMAHMQAVLQKFRSREGHVVIEPFAQLERALKLAGVPKKRAERIAARFWAFIRGDVKEPILRNLREWWKAYYEAENGLLPRDERIFVGVLSRKASVYEQGINLTSRSGGRLMVFLPAPDTETEDDAWVVALLGTLAHAEGTYFLERWIAATSYLKERTGETDEFAKFIDYSTEPPTPPRMFSLAILRFRAEWMINSLAHLWIPEKERRSSILRYFLDSMLAEYQLTPELGPMRRALGITNNLGYFPRIDYIMRTMDATIVRGTAHLN